MCRAAPIGVPSMARVRRKHAARTGRPTSHVKRAAGALPLKMAAALYTHARRAPIGVHTCTDTGGHPPI